MIALCKALQNDHVAAEQYAAELKGEGSAAEEFATLLVEGVGEDDASVGQDAMRLSAG